MVMVTAVGGRSKAPGRRSQKVTERVMMSMRRRWAGAEVVVVMVMIAMRRLKPPGRTLRI